MKANSKAHLFSNAGLLGMISGNILDLYQQSFQLYLVQ